MNILVIDDNIATCTLLAAYLKRIDPLVKVAFATTEMQAIDYAETGQFRLVMVDTDLGGRAKGLNLVTKLEKYQKEAKFVLLAVDNKILGPAEEIGVPCLSKPVDPKKLKAFLSLSTV